jgi:hypothetical protein
MWQRAFEWNKKISTTNRLRRVFQPQLIKSLFREAYKRDSVKRDGAEYFVRIMEDHWWKILSEKWPFVQNVAPKMAIRRNFVRKIEEEHS